MKKEFKHLQAAHCENGVAAGLLQYHGLDSITEPMAFGLGSGIFYIHVPFLMINNGPAINYRSMPGWIFNGACKALNVDVTRIKFSSEKKAEDYLDKKLEEGVPVGCQVGVFNLPYFPPEYRFHFNAHNIIVFGKEGNNYLISDPVMETTTVLTKEELTKVRFSKGPLAPNGQIYFPENVSPVSDETIRKGIIKGLKKTNIMMRHLPGPIVGVAGIKYTAKHVRKWRDKIGVRKAGLYLGQIVRMQEEIGTGGGGFRFLFAAFLEQSHKYVKNDEFLKLSEDFTKSGDMWRAAAIQMAGIYKGRLKEQSDFDQVADMMIEISEVEKQAFKSLSKAY